MLLQQQKEELKRYFGDIYSGLTIEGLQEFTKKYPADVVKEAALDSKLLHLILGTLYIECHLDLVKYVVDMAPTAVSTVVAGGHVSDRFEGEVLPLHLACDNKDCPDSVIKFLIEKYPSAAEHSINRLRGGCWFPLHYYLMRAVETFATYGYDEGTDEHYEECPEYPEQQLDYDIVEMLVRAYPEALTSGSPMNILCQGCAVTLELAQLLTDKEQKCFKVDESEVEFPMRCLLGNEDVDSFPTDVFRYFMECSPSSLRRQKPVDVDYDEGDDFGSGTMSTDTLLHVACSNPEISVEAIQIIVNECPYMVKEEYAYDGSLPLHNLCCNEDLDYESSIRLKY